MSQDRTQPIVHVRDNSDTELEALFNIAMNPSLATETNKSVPLRMRNLPASFFRPPEPQKQVLGNYGNKDSEADSTGFLGPVNQFTNIAHTRAHSSPASLQQSLNSTPPPPPTAHLRQHSYDALDEHPLPEGWDMAKTPQGQRYYLNHVLQITTWNDPRKTHGTGNPSIIPNSNNNNTKTVNFNNSSSPSTGSSTITDQTTGSSSIDVENVPLPPGWERAFTADGEVYFINHIDRNTSWFHPSISSHLQRPGMKFHQQQQSESVISPHQQQQSESVISPQQEQLKHLKLQQLHLEHEFLKKMQNEFARQEMALRAQVGEPGIENQGDDLTSITNPFFEHNGTSEHHSRQESGDSGLGGMGTSYSLPVTPDFLGNMEDMDTQDGGSKLHGHSDFDNIYMAGISDVGDHLTLDSEDLVPSLQEENNNNELFFTDVETVLNNKDNPLTWL